MNTPKTFEPVVTEAMIKVGRASNEGYSCDIEESFAGMCAHPDFQRQLRAYAAEVARAMVPERRVVPLIAAFDKHFRAEIESFNACRAATLSAIDEWEKNDG